MMPLDPSIPSAPPRVLVVDDCVAIHRLVEVSLREQAEVICVSGGQEAIAFVHEKRCDLVLLDIDLPGLDGFEVCRRLKETPQTQQIPIIFLSTTASVEEKVRALDLGAVDYVTKPFHPAELLARVRAALRTARLMALLAEKAHLDGLTSLHNRRHFDEQLTAAASVARRHSRPLSCIACDVDHFKVVNDTHGHPFGDRVLQAIARLLAGGCRSEDIVCRTGGEEFGMLLPDVDLEGATALAERLRQAVEQLALRIGQRAVPVTASFGIAAFDPTSRHGERRIVTDADEALYLAKRQGRNRVCRFGEACELRVSA